LNDLQCINYPQIAKHSNEGDCCNCRLPSRKRKVVKLLASCVFTVLFDSLPPPPPPPIPTPALPVNVTVPVHTHTAASSATASAQLDRSCREALLIILIAIFIRFVWPWIQRQARRRRPQQQQRHTVDQEVDDPVVIPQPQPQSLPLTRVCKVRSQPDQLNMELLSYHDKFVTYNPLGRVFEFDKVYAPSASQDKVFYMEVDSLVASVVDGQKICIAAYGRPTGKSFNLHNTFLTNHEDDGPHMLDTTLPANHDGSSFVHCLQLRERSNLLLFSLMRLIPFCLHGAIKRMDQAGESRRSFSLHSMELEVATKTRSC
jgi:hypothetical protein